MDSLKNQSDRGYEYYKQNKKRRSSVSGSGSSVSQSGSYSRPYSE